MLRTQIDSLDLLVVPHVFRRSLSNQSAPVENDNSARMGEDNIHVVFGEKHGNTAFGDDLGGQGHEFDTFLRRHAGGRLIQQQEFGLIG
jgi:hypothetical protein